MANTSSSPQRACISLRKTNKPLMEKRRRARINDSLTQLKSLIIHNSKRDSSHFNKLEKADILELTVKHLRNLQEQQQQHQTVQSSDVSLAGKYQAGFMECANEVMRYIGQSQGFSEDVKSRVIHHLASCIKLSSKQSFTKPVQQTTNSTTSNPSSMTNGLHAVSTQFPSGQIIQIVNTQLQNVKNSSSEQFPGSIPVAPTASNLPVSSTTTTTHIPVIITSNQTNTTSPAESFHIRYTQPLHIQIPPVLSPVIIQPKTSQLHKQPHHQILNKIQDTVQRTQCNAQQETLVSSSAPSPQPTDLATSSPVIQPTIQKPHFYYTHDDPYADFLPRSRTYSLASSASTESELTSPLNLSQSPKYYDHKEIINYSNQMDTNQFHTSTMDKTSPTHHFSRNILPSQFTSSNFASVIVDGRKNVDNHSFKYIMDEDRLCFRHDGTSSPASSVGEERLWRPW